MKTLLSARGPALEALERRALMSITVVHDLTPDPTAGRPAIHFAISNGVGFFTRDASVGIAALWRTDGVDASYVHGVDVYIGVTNLRPVAAGVAWVQTAASFDHPLWRSDGTHDGTYQLGTVGGIHGTMGELAPIVSLHGHYYVNDEDPGGTPVYESDGNTIWNRGVIPGKWSGVAPYSNGVLFDSGRAGSRNIYTLDAAGTIGPLTNNALLGGDAIVPAQVADGAIFLVRQPNQSYALWRTDGTIAGTMPLATFNDVTSIAEGADSFQNETRRVVVEITHSDGSKMLWVTDGTTTGTRQILSGDFLGNVQVVAGVGNKTLFTNRNTTDAQLWSTDGTAAGTNLLGPYTPAPSPGVPAVGSGFANYRNAVYFTNTDPEHGTELWRTDGTPAGTRLYADIAPGTGFSNAWPYGVVGRHMLFGVGSDRYTGAILSLTNPVSANPPVDEVSPPISLGTAKVIQDDALGLRQVDDLPS
jgi:ELWxxDGT repeat protein